MQRILPSLFLFAALATTAAAHADDMYSYNFSGTGVSGSGSFTIPSTPTDGTFEVSSISGQVNGANITGLLPTESFKNNDNLFSETDPYLDENGVSFLLDDGADVNIFYINGDWFFEGDGNFVLGGGGSQSEARQFETQSFRPNISGDTTVELDNFSFAPESVIVTPEPSSFVLLGTGVLGAAGIMRRRLVRA
jgi:hypothetical protein